MGRGGRKNRGSKRRRTEEETVTTGETNDGGSSSGGVRIETRLFDAPQHTDVMDEFPTPAAGPWDAAWRRIARQNWPKETTCREPTSVQNHVWPILCPSAQEADSNSNPKKWNLICLSPTGSGKTLAYGLPLLLTPQSGKSSLILLPTRELVQQVGRELLRASKALLPSDADPDKKKTATRISVQTIHGGVDRQDQLDTIKRNLRQPRTHSILVATSGRLVDLVSLAASEKKESLLESVHTVILDEADQLANNRDLEAQIESILMTQLQPPFRICLFSATWPDKVTPKWREWIQRASFSIEPPIPCAIIKVNTVDLMEHAKSNHADGDADAKPAAESPETEKKKIKTGDDEENKNKEEEEGSPSSDDKKVKHQWSEIPSNIIQTLHVCSDHKKPRKLLMTLQQLIASKKEQKERQVALGIIFFAKIKTIQYTSKFLQKEGIASVELHSQMSQSSRERNVLNFKCGKIPIMLATDIAARGLHVSGIRFVINYDFPGNMEHYVHRCGRAGRDGKPATVYSFFTRNLAPLASDIVHLLQTCKQWLDPNLVALAQDGNGTTKKDNSPQGHIKEPGSNSKKNARGELLLSDGNVDARNNDDNDEDDFPSLALDRIVLKRASHVSDASDSDETSADDNED